MFSRVLREIHRRSQFRHKVQAWYYSRLFGACGSGLVLHGNCHIKHPARIFIGKNAGINDGAYLNGLGGITMGNNVTVSANAIIISTGLDPVSIKAEKAHVNKPVVIGNFVQIGAGATILPGVTIGDNTLVGAGAVVTKDVAGNCIVAGNPARVIREIA